MMFKTFHISTCYLFFLHCIMQILQVKIPWTDIDKDTHLLTCTVPAQIITRSDWNKGFLIRICCRICVHAHGIMHCLFWLLSICTVSGSIYMELFLYWLWKGTEMYVNKANGNHSFSASSPVAVHFGCFISSLNLWMEEEHMQWKKPVKMSDILNWNSVYGRVVQMPFCVCWKLLGRYNFNYPSVPRCSAYLYCLWPINTS